MLIGYRLSQLEVSQGLIQTCTLGSFILQLERYYKILVVLVTIKIIAITILVAIVIYFSYGQRRMTISSRIR